MEAASVPEFLLIKCPQCGMYMWSGYDDPFADWRWLDPTLKCALSCATRPASEASSLVDIWNSFAGAPPFGDLKPIKKFTDRKSAAGRIWKAIQVLGEELLRTSIRDAEARLKAARTAPASAPQACV